MVKRNNAYFERRLKDEYPQTYADWKAGKFKTLTDARHSVGLGKPRTRLQEMINGWSKAADQERDDFLDFLNKQGVHLGPALPATGSPSSSAPTTTASPSAPGLGFQIAVGGYLTPDAKARIKEIIDRRGLINALGAPKYGVIMQEMTPPYKALNMALARAVRRGTRLTGDLAKALERWLLDNRNV